MNSRSVFTFFFFRNSSSVTYLSPIKPVRKDFAEEVGLDAVATSVEGRGVVSTAVATSVALSLSESVAIMEKSNKKGTQ